MQPQRYRHGALTVTAGQARGADRRAQAETQTPSAAGEADRKCQGRPPGENMLSPTHMQKVLQIAQTLAAIHGKPVIFLTHLPS